MRRLTLLGLAIALLGVIITPLGGSAQDTTATGVGSPTPIFGLDGTQIGSITVDEIIDPFTAHDSNYAPPRGYHYAAIVVTIENTASRPFEVNPSNIQTIDSDGFIVQQGFVQVIEAEAPILLEYLDALAPGTSATGAIVVEVFNDSEIERVVYSPDFNILQTVVDLRDAPTAAGTPVSIIGSNGLEIAQIGVVSIADPWDGYEEFDAPDRGTRYVLVEVSFTNTSDQIVTTGSNDFIAIDDQGIVIDPGFVSFSDPSMTSYDFVDLEPGATQQGFIAYQVFADLPIVQIVYGDRFDRSIVIADLGDGAPSAPTPAAQSSTTDTDSTGTDTDSDSTGTDTTALDSTPECEGLVDWGVDLVDRLGASVALVEPLTAENVESLDSATIATVAADLRALGDEQAATSTPSAAQALNDFMVTEYYYALADVADSLADALDTGNFAAALIATANANAVSSLFDDGGAADLLFDDLETSCPAEVNALDNL